MSYSIIYGNSNGDFTVNSNGSITLSKSLDRERTPSYILTIAATDSSSTGTTKQSTISLVIAVSDVNDNPPIFTGSLCQANVYDDAALSTNVLTVTATDADSGKNADIYYKLVTMDSNFLKFFRFDEQSRSLIVNSELNLDAFDVVDMSVRFVVQALDKGSPQLSNTLNCTVKIIGANKHPPVLLHNHEIYSYIDINLNSDINFVTIAKINATDADFGSDGELTFTIINGNDGNVFKISSHGKITLQDTPSNGFYYLTAIVSDNASQGKRKSISCYVFVYFKSIKMDVGGISAIGKVRDEITTVMKDEYTTIPFFIQLGWNYIEGLEIDLTFDAEDLLIVSVTSDFKVLKISNNGLKIVGLTSYREDVLGIINIANVKIKALKTGKWTYSSKINNLIDREMKLIPTKDINVCMSGKSYLNSDCDFDILDVAFAQTYCREQETNFTSNLGQKLKSSVSTAQKNFMDSDYNDVIDLNDVKILLDVLLGESMKISQFIVAVPNSKKNTKEKCTFEITAAFDVLSIDKSDKDLKTYILFTYPHDSLRIQLKKSGLEIVSYYIMPTNSDMKYGDLVALKGTSIHTLLTASSAINLLNVGISLIFVVKDISNKAYVTTTFFKTGPNTSSTNFTLPDNLVVNIGYNFKPQMKFSFNETTYRCNYPQGKTWLGLRLHGDYDEIVKGNEATFKADFKAFFEKRELEKHSRIVEVLNISVAKGSILVNMYLLHENRHYDPIIKDLLEALPDKEVAFNFNGSLLYAENSLFVDDEQRVHDDDDDDDIILIIALVILFLLLLLLIIVLIICVMKKKRKTKSFELASEEDAKEEQVWHICFFYFLLYFILH